MAMTLEEVRTAVMQLKDSDRELLVIDLLQEFETIDPEVEKAWQIEIARRLEDIRTGKAQMLSGTEVLNELREELADRRAYDKAKADADDESIPLEEALSEIEEQSRCNRMAMTLQELEQAARDLPREDQLRLAALLTEHVRKNVDPDIEKAWVAEAGRRLQEIRAGKDVLLDLDTVLAEAEKIAGE